MLQLSQQQRDPDLFAIELAGIGVCDESPHYVRFSSSASSRVSLQVAALQFDRQPETLGELLALLGYGGMLHEALLRVEALPVEERPAAIMREVFVASTEYPADHGAAMLAYLTSDCGALAEIHRGYFGALVKTMSYAVDEAVRVFLASAEPGPPPLLH